MQKTLDDILINDKNREFDELWNDIYQCNFDESIDKTPQINRCLNCKSSNLIVRCQNGSSDDYIVCYECGVVKEESIDINSCFENDEGVGAQINYFYPKSSLGTTISGKASRVKLINQWNLQPYEEKVLQEVFKEIEKVCKAYKIHRQIINTTLNLYKKVNDSKHTFGKNMGKKIIKRRFNLIGLKAACVYFACKLYKHPKSVTFIANMFNIDNKNVSKGIKIFMSMLRTSKDDMYFNLGTINPEDFIRDYCTHLKITAENSKLAHTICQNIDAIQIATDHQPTSIAAVSILLMAQLKNVSVTKKELRDMFEISDVTLSKIYNKAYPLLGILQDSELTKEFITDIYKQISLHP